MATVVAVAAIGGTGAAEAGAATFTVNTRADAKDRNINGICDTRAEDGRQCTLRGALLEANATAAEDRIEFDIGAADQVRTIAPRRELPHLRQPVTINGYTQPGAQENTLASGDNAEILIELSGVNTFDTTGLTIRGKDNVVKGLAINRWQHYGIRLDDASRNVIAGNFIGTDVTGSLPQQNDVTGVYVDVGDNNRIGAASPAGRNVISGNGSHGVFITIQSSSDTADSNRVLGNYIGVASDGVSAMGNDGYGVILQGSSNQVGGVEPGAGNVIAHNTKAGVGLGLITGVDNAILGNSIHTTDNADRLGIEIGCCGITPNDPDDGDTGPNNAQNFPVISKAETLGPGTTVIGTLNSVPSRSYRIEFFANDENVREGKVFVGQTTVTTDAQGDASFSVPTARVPVGDFVTATATDPEGDTSEFSAPQIAGAPVIKG